MFPLTFGSNVFVPRDHARLAAGLRPRQPGDRAHRRDRGLVLGGPVATAAWHAVLWSVAITVVFAPLAVRVYRRRT